MFYRAKEYCLMQLGVWDVVSLPADPVQSFGGDSGGEAPGKFLNFAPR